MVKIYLDTANKKSTLNLRPCVEKSYRNGAQTVAERDKMRHALIFELRRLGYSFEEIEDMLTEWNARCLKPYKTDDDISGYIGWFETVEGNAQLGCNALEDYCIGKNDCWFHRKDEDAKRRQTNSLPFDIEGLDRYLTGQYKSRAYMCILVVKVLRQFQQEKNPGPTICVGFREIASRIKKYGHTVEPMMIVRCMKVLEDEGVLSKIASGRPGRFTHRANSYMFNQWIAPPLKGDVTHNKSLSVNK